MILVTGGAGFIGSALVWGLNQEGRHDVLVVDRLGLGEKWRNLSQRQLDFVLHKDQLFAWLEANPSIECEAVFHLGACSATTERDADYLMDNNVIFSQKLWQFCCRRRIPFLYASSAATYGAEEENFSDELPRPLQPINKYGWSKQLFDAWALKQRQTPPAWFGFKFFNVYGPNEYHKGAQASVVYHAYPQVRDRGQLRLFKSYRSAVAHGEQKRDFVYVKDVVKVLLHFLAGAAQIPSGLYNLGTGEARSFVDLGHAVFAALNRPAQFDWIEMPDQLRSQYQYFTEARLHKLRELAGYHAPFFSLEAGVSDYVQQHLQQTNAYL